MTSFQYPGAIRYPIAEAFQSIQGEGFFQGLPMFFIRFAGCSVGRPLKEEERGGQTPKYIEQCHTVFGNAFLCDTNFQLSRWYDLDDLVNLVPPKIRVCLTGGEPLIHNLVPFVKALLGRCMGNSISLETSGTILIPTAITNHCWTTVAPKINYLQDNLQYADEIKILVDDRITEKQIEDLVQDIPSTTYIFIQPINKEKEISRENLDRCLDILSRHPSWRLSVQLHKFLGVR